jgi:hypothetical protein
MYVCMYTYNIYIYIYIYIYIHIYRYVGEVPMLALDDILEDSSPLSLSVCLSVSVYI